LAATVIGAGARGVVFGRNVLQARSPIRFLLALRAVVREAVPADEAADRYGIAEAATD
jgi:DhnA family fructose-bisphosphate aldolase class Ia